MKRFIALFAAVILISLCVAPALAAGLSISPPTVEFDVPASGSAQVEFVVYDFTGDLEISLEDIPLRVEPATVSVTGGSKVVLTLYGDESLGSKIYKGKIRFLAMTGGTVAMGIKVRATVTNLVEGETPVLAAPEESQPPASQEPTEEIQGPAPPAPPPGPPPASTTGLPPSTIIAAAASVLFLILIATIIIRTAKRPSYRRPRY